MTADRSSRRPVRARRRTAPPAVPAVLAALLTAALTATASVPAVAEPSPANDAIPAVDAIPADLLDRPAPGASAEGNGGYDPALPDDPEVLGRWLGALRARGVPPARYATLLAQYWAAVGARAAGLDLDAWDPSLGLAPNVGNLEKTFAYYCRLGLEHPELLWAGQGGLAGPSFAAGVMDLDQSRVVLDAAVARDALTGSLGAAGALAAPAAAGLPGDVRALLEVGGLLRTEDVDAFQRAVVAMSKHIFLDLIPQHEAYLAGGLPALQEYRDAGLIDDATLAAWRTVARGAADGDEQSVVDGNLTLLHREQFDVIGDQWDAVSAYRGPVGRALTYLSTVAADPAIPGLQPPREYAPLVVDAGQVGSSGWRVRTPLPAFDWADREARWEYITARMAPRYRELRYRDEPLWRDSLTRPVTLRIADQRALARLPQMLTSMVRVTGSA